MPKRGATGEPGGATKFEQAGIDAIAFPRNGDGLVYVFATHTAPNTAVASVVTPTSTLGSIGGKRRPGVRWASPRRRSLTYWMDCTLKRTRSGSLGFKHCQSFEELSDAVEMSDATVGDLHLI